MRLGTSRSSAPLCCAAFVAFATLGGRVASPGHAAGYAINDQGARAMGMGLATSAMLEGPESLFYNPAGLAQIRDWSVAAGGTQLLADFEATPEETGSARWTSSRDRFTVPHLYVARGLRGPWSLGLAINAPFGLATEWAKDFPGRFISRVADLQTMQVAPIAGLRLPHGWSLGFGPTWTRGKVQLVRDVDLSIFRAGHQCQADLTGDGGSWGYRLGARWRGHSGWGFGFAWQGETSLHFRGQVDYTVPELGAYSLDQAIMTLFQDGPAGTTLTLPATITSGVGRVQGRWTWGADLTWTHWSVLDSVVVDLDPIEAGGQSLVVEEFTVNNWRDVLAFRAGLRRNVGDHWSWMAGAYFDQSPVPVKTADPLLPDSDRTSFTGGFSFQRGRFSLDVSAQFVVFEKLDTRGTDNEFPSQYESGVQGLACTAGWRWGRATGDKVERRHQK